MAEETIKVETSDLENMILQSIKVTDLLGQVVNKIKNVIDKIPNLSSKGSFCELIVTSSSNGGLELFSMKAREFLNLSEVFTQHIQNTYKEMVDADRILAIYIANMMLNDPETSEEDKQTIRDHPEETIAEFIKQIKGENAPMEGGEEE